MRPGTVSEPRVVEEAEGDLAGGGVGVGADLVGGLPTSARARSTEVRGAPRGSGEVGPGGEQVDAQVLFEADHGPRQGGLRDLISCAARVTMLGAGDAGEVHEAWREQRDDVFCVTDGDR